MWVSVLTSTPIVSQAEQYLVVPPADQTGFATGPIKGKSNTDMNILAISKHIFVYKLQYLIHYLQLSGYKLMPDAMVII